MEVKLNASTDLRILTKHYGGWTQISMREYTFTPTCADLEFANGRRAPVTHCRYANRDGVDINRDRVGDSTRGLLKVYHARSLVRSACGARDSCYSTGEWQTPDSGVRIRELSATIGYGQDERGPRLRDGAPGELRLRSSMKDATAGLLWSKKWSTHCDVVLWRWIFTRYKSGGKQFRIKTSLIASYMYG